ncbi:toll-like receptor 4 [Mya arenaria]|uniref:toll-like receptor 4 n=1 Tax=Mya arenaria TaxID=6604 RepID=UPI0022E4E75A|nr:toll-like receptor 4 [Mya arenaria]
MTKLYLYFLFSVLVSISKAKDLYMECGPRNACGCERFDNVSIRMNCEAMHVRLSETCDSIRNLSGEVMELFIGGNNLGNFGMNDFHGCEEIQILGLQFNQITRMEENVFKKLKRLTVLDLSRNNLRIYEHGFKTTFIPKTVQILRIKGNFYGENDNNDLPMYPSFSRLKRLQELHIDGINGVNFGISYADMNLTHVDISGLVKYSYCNLTEITNTTFQHLNSVKSLNISGCSVRNICAGAFIKLLQLQTLDLSFNRQLGFTPLSNVSYGLQFTNIKVLNYSHVYTTFGTGTKLYKKDICYLRNTTLKEMVLDNNRIELIETNAAILVPRSLETSYLRQNKLTFGPYILQMGCLEGVKNFYLECPNFQFSPLAYSLEPEDRHENTRSSTSNCPFMAESELQKIAEKNKNCLYYDPKIPVRLQYPRIPPSLEKLYYHDCELTYKIISNDYKFFPENNNLSYLDVSGNIFNAMTGHMNNLPELRYIGISRNYCKAIGLTTLNWEKLENLQLDINFLGTALAISDRANIFDLLPNLKILNLSSNGITTLFSRTFHRLQKLRHLDLSFNNIENFDLNIKPLKNLLIIDLQVNSVHTLKENIIKQLEQNSKRLNTSFLVDLRNNSISYGCDNLHFLQWLATHEHNFVGFNGYWFVADNSSILSFDDFKRDIEYLPKRCKTYVVLIVICSISVAVFLSIVIGGVIYKNRWKLRYLLFMSRQRYFGYRRLDDETIIENYKYDAFISYAEENIRFIRDRIIPELEGRGLSLCIHQRDFLAGNDVTDNIINAIKRSKKTITILSNGFFRSKWCMYEFNMARMETIYSREDRGCLVIVMLEKIPADRMSAEMLEWIKKNSYIEYTTDEEGEALFWEKLRIGIEN